MPSKTDFNVSPYYDDFSEAKKFHRVMYRPAFAVQARELTTQQSILQNQIEQMGHVQIYLSQKGSSKRILLEHIVRKGTIKKNLELFINI